MEKKCLKPSVVAQCSLWHQAQQRWKKSKQKCEEPDKTHGKYLVLYKWAPCLCLKCCLSFLPPRRQKNQEFRGRSSEKGEELSILEVFHSQWIFRVAGRRVKEGDAILKVLSENTQQKRCLKKKITTQGCQMLGVLQNQAGTVSSTAKPFKTQKLQK